MNIVESRLWTLATVAAIALAVSVMCACSSGPQLPVITTPVTVTCSWTITNGDGGTVELRDNDCLADRISAAPGTTTTGNEVRDNNVSPEVRTNVSATGGTGGP